VTTARPLPDFAHLHDELQRHKHMTLQLLWKSTAQQPRTDMLIEIFHKGTRVASHVRLHKPYAAAINPIMVPVAPCALGLATLALGAVAHNVGANTAEVVAKIMASYPHPEMGYRSCLRLISAWDNVIQLRE